MSKSSIYYPAILFEIRTRFPSFELSANTATNEANIFRKLFVAVFSAIV